LGERLLCKQEVDGSIPFTSTKSRCQGSGIRDQEERGARLDREKKQRVCHWAWSSMAIDL
jgi:hypothetical protein